MKQVYIFFMSWDPGTLGTKDAGINWQKKFKTAQSSSHGMSNVWGFKSVLIHNQEQTAQLNDFKVFSFQRKETLIKVDFGQGKPWFS